LKMDPRIVRRMTNDMIDEIDRDILWSICGMVRNGEKVKLPEPVLDRGICFACFSRYSASAIEFDTAWDHGQTVCHFLDVAHTRNNFGRIPEGCPFTLEHVMKMEKSRC
jgi:hypothetical protein